MWVIWHVEHCITISCAQFHVLGLWGGAGYSGIVMCHGWSFYQVTMEEAYVWIAFSSNYVLRGKLQETTFGTLAKTHLIFSFRLSGLYLSASPLLVTIHMALYMVRFNGPLNELCLLVHYPMVMYPWCLWLGGTHGQAQPCIVTNFLYSKQNNHLNTLSWRLLFIM